MALASPTKKGKKLPVQLIDDEEQPESPASEEESVEDLRKRFVGDVDLPEGVYYYLYMPYSH